MTCNFLHLFLIKTCLEYSRTDRTIYRVTGEVMINIGRVQQILDKLSNAINPNYTFRIPGKIKLLKFIVLLSLFRNKFFIHPFNYYRNVWYITRLCRNFFLIENSLKFLWILRYLKLRNSTLYWIWNFSKRLLIIIDLSILKYSYKMLNYNK